MKEQPSARGGGYGLPTAAASNPKRYCRTNRPPAPDMRLRAADSCDVEPEEVLPHHQNCPPRLPFRFFRRIFA